MTRLRLVLVLVLSPIAFAPAFPPHPTALPAFPTKQDQLRAEWPTKREEYWKQIRDAVATGKYEHAVAITGKLLDLERELLGANHELVADSLSRLATIQLDARDYPAAGKTARESAELFAKRYSPTHWRATDGHATAELGTRVAKLTRDERDRLAEADRTYDEAYAFHTRRDHRAALPKYTVALGEYRKLLGKNTRPEVDALIGLGHVYTELRDFGKAAEFLKQAEAICTAVYGPIHPNAGTILNHSGVLAIYRADYPRAEACFKKALEIHRQTSGPKSDATALCLANLGGLAAELGDYMGAIRTLAEAYEILRANHGVLNHDVATILHKVGYSRMELGDYNTAEQAMQLALEIRRRLDGEPSPACVHSLNGLGVLYLRIGDQRGADRALTRTADLASIVFGEGSIEYAATLNNLGSLYAEVGRYPEAEDAFRKAVKIKTTLLGEKHPDTVLGLHNLGTVLRQAGKIEEAEPIVLKSSALAKEVWGERHPEYPTTRFSLAELYLLKGEYRRAEELANEALAGHERIRGPVHPLVADALELRGKIEAATERPQVALATLERALRIRDQHLRMVFGFATESAMQSALWRATNTMKVLLSVVRSKLSDDPVATEAALTSILRHKAGVLDAMCRHREVLLLTRNDPDVLKEADTVRKSFARYQHLAAAPPTAGGDEMTQVVAITDARREYEEAEGRLRRVVDLVRPPAIPAEVTAAAVRRRLPAGSALVEFVRVEPYDFKATGKAPVWLSARYFALILRSDPAVPVRLIDLGDAAEIQRGVRELRAAITRAPRDLKSSSEKQLDADYRELATGLSKKVFAPLQKALGGARVVYLAPDADLNLLPFEALVDTEGRYLIDTYRFNYLSSGRDLLRTQAKPGTGTVVFAGPDFDWRPNIVGPLQPVGPVDVAVRAGVSSGSTVRGSEGLRWRPLPGAAREAEDLKGTFDGTAFGPVTAFTGAAARKSTFRALAAPPRVMHIATHGYFMPLRSDGDIERSSATTVGLPPLLRSGLILAGANQRPEANSIMEDNGWLTAEEVGLKNLRGTELVVLSACESGLGEVQAGEGVFGLRRAFLYAGAETLMVSLFKVPDAETRDLMLAFYQGIKDGKGHMMSLHDSKRAVIAERRIANGAAHPFFWASFIAIGGAE
ncbi:MAG: CHAT domain-containing protein [Planctomycetes bacterium]|nr:CHAT domain-containing protein [Planctomycetota bacterium]